MILKMWLIGSVAVNPFPESTSHAGTLHHSMVAVGVAIYDPHGHFNWIKLV